MTPNTNVKMFWAIAVLIIVAGGAYMYAASSRAPAPNAAETAAPLVIQGTVTKVDVPALQIVLQAATTSPLKVVDISPTTKIEKIVSQKDAKGAIEKQAAVEVTIGDVPKGSQVTVLYQSEKDGVLSGVSQVSFTVEGDVDAALKAQAANQIPYLKGKVIAVDNAGKTLTYTPYFFDTLATSTASVAIPDGIAVYRVDDSSRVSITYARMPATLADIQSGQVILIQVDPAALKAGRVIPQAFIISVK